MKKQTYSHPEVKILLLNSDIILASNLGNAENETTDIYGAEWY